MWLALLTFGAPLCPGHSPAAARTPLGDRAPLDGCGPARGALAGILVRPGHDRAGAGDRLAGRRPPGASAPVGDRRGGNRRRYDTSIAGVSPGPTSTCRPRASSILDEHPEVQTDAQIQWRSLPGFRSGWFRIPQLHEAVRRGVRRLSGCCGSRPATAAPCCCSQAIRTPCSRGFASLRAAQPFGCGSHRRAAGNLSACTPASDVLLNTPDIEIWPAGLLRARSNHDARLLARARHVLRRKRDGRYLAVELREGARADLPAFAREPGMDARAGGAAATACSARAGNRRGRTCCR